LRLKAILSHMKPLSSASLEEKTNRNDDQCLTYQDDDLKSITLLITEHPDFPQKGILFRDIFPIFRNPIAVEMLINRLLSHIFSCVGKPDVIVGLDSRGFLFGPILAVRAGAAFAPIRKKGKLPGEVVTESYQKEYGKDEFDLQKDAIKSGDKVLIVDDLLATGGTMEAAIKLVQKLGGIVLECLVVIELDALKGRDRLSSRVHALLHY